MITKLWEEAEKAYKGAFRFYRFGDLTRAILYLRLAIKKAEDLIYLFEKELKEKKG